MVEHEQRYRFPGRSFTSMRVAVLVGAVLALSLLGAGTASAVTRDTVLTRAQTWVDLPVPYSQHRYYAGYRTDCSGFASMTWQAAMSYTTRSMHLVAHPVAAADLKPGDALLKYDYHIRIFYGWVDAAHTQYVAYEQTGPTTKSSIKSIASDLALGYRPYRYNRITDSPAPQNLLLNPSFDVWAGDWRGEGPVWWSVSGDDPGTEAVHRRDVHRTSRSSLELMNPSSDPSCVSELSQTATVSANATYTLSLWATTDGAPASLRLSMRCVDASGVVLSQRSTPGDARGLDALAFRLMSMTVVTPPGTVRAAVTVSLAGGSGSATDSAGVFAVLDDISLARPPLPLATLTVPHTPSSPRRGTVFTGYGYLTPRHPAGTSAVSLQCYRYESGHWVLRKTVKATVSDSSAGSRYSVRMSLPMAGKWRVRALHADAGHRASYSAYRSLTVL